MIVLKIRCEECGRPLTDCEIEETMSDTLCINCAWPEDSQPDETDIIIYLN